MLHLPIVRLFEDDEILCIDKPPSLPVHPCGAYNKNSLVRILELEEGLVDTHRTPCSPAIHRLDKLTSGLLVMAKGQKNTVKYQTEMKLNNVHKKYLARVAGKPKEDKFVVDRPMFCASAKHSRHAIAVTDEEVQQAKSALTRFEVLWYDEPSDTSLLACFPLTGRTHQIRVHLQSVGHSIINDVNYGGRRVGNKRLELLRDLYPEEWSAVESVHKPRSKLEDKRDLDENGCLLPEEVPPPLKKLIVQPEGKPEPAETLAQSSDQAKAPQQDPQPAETQAEAAPEPPAPEDEEDEKMFFNYGDNNAMPYTPFNEERMMEIWLHSSEYNILGKSLKSKDPYWVQKEILHPGFKPEPAILEQTGADAHQAETDKSVESLANN